jgi:hypothetical protein
MSRTTLSGETDNVTIRHSMNDHGAMCVEVADRNAVRHVVDYAGADVRETLEALPEGATLPLEMEPLEDRANVWRAVAIDRPRARPGARVASGD